MVSSLPDAGFSEFRRRARPFGEARADLELDFPSSSRAELVDRILEDCLTDAEGASDARHPKGEIREWTLQRRLVALAAVAAATHGSRLELTYRCECGETLELAVCVKALLEHALQDSDGVARATTCEPELSRRLEVRSPTGMDQARWGEMRFSESSIARDLVVSVDGNAPLGDWALPQSWLNVMAEALSRLDPLSDLKLTTACPECGSASELELDLEAELLARLSAVPALLLDQIHRLARAYHWTEGEIMALPAFRRAEYLARIDAEEGA